MTHEAVLRVIEGPGPDRDGTVWLSPASDVERSLLAALDGPVLDVGCGPGRHVVALAELGVPAMGIDVTPAALDLARAHGAPVLSRSVFDRVPAAGRWGSALLLDGNVGIGADPVTLLQRVAELLRPGGSVLVETIDDGHASEPRTVRLECSGSAGPPFPWVEVGVDDLPPAAQGAGLCIGAVTAAGRRRFAYLEKPRASP